jgi:hypothetical protein
LSNQSSIHVSCSILLCIVDRQFAAQQRIPFQTPDEFFHNEPAYQSAADIAAATVAAQSQSCVGLLLVHPEDKGGLCYVTPHTTLSLVARALPSSSPPRNERDHSRAVYIDDCVYIIGGDKRGLLSVWDHTRATRTMTIYHVPTQTWRAAADMHMPRSRDHLAVAISNRSILVISGDASSASDNRCSCEVYDIVAGSWRQIDLTPPFYERIITQWSGVCIWRA